MATAMLVYPACPGLMYDSYAYFEKHLKHRIVFMIAPVWTNLTNIVEMGGSTTTEYIP